MKRILFFLLGLIGFLSLLCSIAATSVTNENQMRQGFLQFARTGHLNVSISRYGDYAQAISGYLDGKTAAVQVKNPDSGELENAFSDKENRHLADVKGIVDLLKAVRFGGGGFVVGAVLVLYLRKKQERGRLLSDVTGGFAGAAIALLLIAAALGVWGLINFKGLFWTFHQVSFANDLWLLDPGTDLLVALMPLEFFIWYAKQMLLSMLPILGIMALVIIAWFRIGKQHKETETK